ncbi:MAG: hypothetical protein Q4G40_12145, partial [Brachybacterium sp.]|nr:hypothetical protein [Brachybacterium sp.]
AVLRYARALGEVAREDVASISLPAGDGTDQAAPSDDVLVMRAVVGMVAFDRLARILRSLGHASYSMTGAATGQERGR